MLEFLVQLDPALQEAIAIAVAAIFSFLILKVGEALPWLGEYLGQHKVGIVTWATTLVVQLIQVQLDRIPATFDTLVVLVMQVIVEALVIFVGFAYLAKKRGVTALQ